MATMGTLRMRITINKMAVGNQTIFIRATSLLIANSSKKSVLSFDRISPTTNIASRRRNHSYKSTSSVAACTAEYDVVIVGGGIVGSATARELCLRYPKLKLAVLEKEDKLAVHQSGHNSGVIHAGVYYTPGSLKAKLCVQGMALVYDYCDRKRIAYKKCGKLIVAVEPDELPRLKILFERGTKNGVKDLQMVGSEKLRELEPHCRGLQAIWSPHTGIVDFQQVSRQYAADFQEIGGTIHFGFDVSAFRLNSKPKFPVLVVGKKNETVSCRYVVTCGGLHSDRLAEMSGCSSDPKIIPFRGEYLVLKRNKRHLIRGNIYPVPNPNFPFLGVHFTPRMDGNVWLGPNAVFAFRREGYRFKDFSYSDLMDAVRFKGFRKVASSYAMFGMGEMFRSFFMSAQVKKLQRFIPELRTKDVERGPAGVRAQSMSLDGKLVDDFVFDDGRGDLAPLVLHVRNAPSPGATSSLAIAKMVADKAADKFYL